MDSSERCGGTVQAVACGAVVAAGDRGQSRSPLVPSGDGLREGDNVDHEAAMSFGFS